ncbi:MAG: hypothetical protein AAGD23_06835 [Pseudomonadota bacterium]
MLKGRDALTAIERAVGEIREDIDRLAGRIAKLTDARGKTASEESEAFRRLAELRLDALRNGELSEPLARVEARAAELIAQHDASLDALESSLDETDQARAALLAKRSKRVADEDKAAKALDQAEAAFQKKLEKDKAFVAQSTLVEESRDIVEEAARKAELAASDRAEKGAPYEADPLFMYLWDRKFLTGDYRANPVIRFFDRWVAGIVRYRDAAANYRMLLEIPRRLQEHVDAQQSELEEEIASLEKLEAEARGAAGLNELAKALADVEQAVLDIDADVEAESERRAELERERSAHVRGDDGPFAEALRLMTGAMQRQDLRSLYREARLTRSREDDRVVDEIEDRRQDLAETERDIAQLRESLRALEARRAEIEGVRTRFVKSGYDRWDSFFTDDDFLKSLLVGLVRGAISGSGLWHELERHHRRQRKSNSRFGSQRYRFPGSSKPWGGSVGGRWGGSWGSGRRSSGSSWGGRVGRSKGGGGFRTGGGF